MPTEASVVEGSGVRSMSTFAQSAIVRGFQRNKSPKDLRSDMFDPRPPPPPHWK